VVVRVEEALSHVLEEEAGTDKPAGTTSENVSSERLS
jgi:hypothetical protein